MTPAALATAPTLKQSSADDGSHASERPRRAHRCRGGGGGVNAAADRLTEELAETANAINTLGTSSARSSLGAKTVTITSGRVVRLSEASAKRQRPREAARLQPTCHPGSRARPLRSRSSGFGFDSDSCDSEGEREREGLESTGVQLVQVPSPSTGKIRTRVRPTAEVPQTAETTIGTIGLPSFMQESEVSAIARPGELRTDLDGSQPLGTVCAPTDSHSFATARVARFAFDRLQYSYARRGCDWEARFGHAARSGLPAGRRAVFARPAGPVPVRSADAAQLPVSPTRASIILRRSALR